MNGSLSTLGRRLLGSFAGAGAFGSIAFAVLAGSASDADRFATPRVLSASDIGDKLRVFATPGDYKLENPHVTAVVRRTDGWLTELWSNRGRLPTAPQLGTTTDIDALWQFHQVVGIGKKSYAVSAQRVAMVDDGIETHGSVEAGGLTYRVVTRYRLDRARARLVISSTFDVERGTAASGVKLGDAFKWGNVQYFVSGLRKPRMKYEGPAEWVGRRGAGGDLMLRPTDPARRMWLRYAARKRGFQGTIEAFHHRKGIPENAKVTVERELVFADLPVKPAGPPSRIGTLVARIVDERDRPLAAKITIGRTGSKRPLFDDDGDLLGTDRFMWTGNGRLEKDLAPGRYDVLVTAGIERDAHRRTIDVRSGRRTTLEARLPRVIDTPGWIGADLHLHQAPSVDADVSLPHRVVSIAAEGVELAVATDHYVVTDLADDVRWMRKRGVLSSRIQTIAGCEVSTLGNRFGHFNVFPLKVGDDVKSFDTTVDELFADARKKSPSGILQVNHPRWAPAIAYWSYFGIDDDTGEMSRPGYNPSFDTVEVYNGDDAGEIKNVRRVLMDWIHQLGRGHRYTATGSSDSHKLAFLDPGLPRTMIRHGGRTTDEDDVLAPAARILGALKAGHAIVTSGPFIDARVDGKGPGETATGVGKTAKLHISVRAASWIDVRSVEVLVGGRGRRAHYLPVPRSGKILRLDRVVDVSVDDKTFVVVTALGERPLANASHDYTQPFAFTNPIWLEP